jgi:hypothetical protein
MSEHIGIYSFAVVGTAAALGLWVWLARQMTARGKSRWRPVLLCLPLVLAAAIYGLFWFGFFLSPAAAVQLHAIRLTIEHAISGYGVAIIAGWLAVSLLPLLPVLRRKA